MRPELRQDWRQQGFGAIAAIVVLVILAALAAAMARFGTVQQLSSAQDILAVRALAAARAGQEWGLYRVLQSNWCGAEGLDLTGDTGFLASVRCAESLQYREGESAVGVPLTFKTYVVTVTACNMPTGGACPNPGAAASPGYVERVVQVVVTK